MRPLHLVAEKLRVRAAAMIEAAELLETMEAPRKNGTASAPVVSISSKAERLDKLASMWRDGIDPDEIARLLGMTVRAVMVTATRAKLGPHGGR